MLWVMHSNLNCWADTQCKHQENYSLSAPRLNCLNISCCLRFIRFCIISRFWWRRLKIAQNDWVASFWDLYCGLKWCRFIATLWAVVGGVMLAVILNTFFVKYGSSCRQHTSPCESRAFMRRIWSSGSAHTEVFLFFKNYHNLCPQSRYIPSRGGVWASVNRKQIVLCTWLVAGLEECGRQEWMWQKRLF